MREVTPEALLALPDDRFVKVVEEDVRIIVRDHHAQRSTPGTIGAALRHPQVISRFYRNLIGVQRGLEGRLATQAAYWEARKHELLGGNPGNPPDEYLEAKAAHAEQRGRALHYKTAVDQTVHEVKQLLDARNVELRHLLVQLRTVSTDPDAEALADQALTLLPAAGR